MKNAFFIIATIFLLLSCKSKHETDDAQLRIQTLQDSLTYYHSLQDSINKTTVADSSSTNSFFGKHEIAKLRMHGLRNAPQQIINDLQRRTDLIPQQGGLGGTMRFWNIQLIKTQWALAEFTDGHATGILLLNYQKDEDDKLQWKVLDQYID